MFQPTSASSPLQHPPSPHERIPTNSQSTLGFSAGATSSGSSIYSNWGGGNASATMNDPFAPSRSHYQPGFLMSVTPGNASPPGGQHFDDPPLIPTKFNSSHSRTSPSDFGLESMFEHPRRPRQPPTDEDGPPTASVNDLMEENSSRFQPRASHPGSPIVPSSSRRPASASQHAPTHKPVTYLNVFGYPPDRYESVSRLFQSLGDTTGPEPSENGMWFTIGYRNSWEAERALRRNGKIMDDSYMIGVAKAHSPQADDTSRAGPSALPSSPPNGDAFSPGKDSMVPYGITRSSTSNSLGMPLTLAPSAAAFKPPKEKNASQREKVFSGPQAQQVGSMPKSSTLSRFSDLIFGW